MIDKTRYRFKQNYFNSIGVDTKFFIPPTKDQKIKAREYFKFKKEEIIIGSFQKDGEGWKRELKLN